MLGRKRQATIRGPTLTDPTWRLGGRMRAVMMVAIDWAQRFGTGPRSLRGNTYPRVAIGGPIHARLTPGNSALRVRFMPCTGSRSKTRQLCGPLTPIRAQTSSRLALLSLGCASLPARQASTIPKAWLIWLTKD